MSADAPISPAWIAVDWGTSNLRAFAMSATDEVMAEVASDQGMGRLTPPMFEPALRDLIQGWTLPSPCTVVACGMVGSRQGWQEAPYRAVPCGTRDVTPTKVSLCASDLEVYLLPGVKQDQPADVMRGEETQIAGFLARNPGWDGVICLPGTHSKWAEVSAAEIVSFRTFMTGELFQLISAQSVLRHSAAGKALSEAAFDEAVSGTLSRPESLAARLFSLRAADLLHGQSADVARGALSGALIGAELAASKPYWLGQRVAIIGNSTLGDLYDRALMAQGIRAERCDAAEVTRAGLVAAYRTL